MIRPAILRFVLGIATLALGLLWASSSAQQSRDLILARSDAVAGLPIYTGSHVLIIGINKYRNLPAKAQLKYAVNDAKELRDVLVGFYGFKDSEVKVLLDDQASLENIRQALNDLADPAKVKTDDRVLVYFSGHGQTITESGGDRGYLIPSDAKVDIEKPDPASFKTTCLPMQEVWDRLDPSPAKHIAVLADACFSGMLTKSKGLFAADYSLSAYLTMPARQAITAGGRGQKTWESDQYRHGLFTYSMLQELKRRAKDKQQVFPMVELFASVLDPVVQMSKGRQVPQYTPFYTEGQMLFFAGGDKAPPDVKPSEHPSQPATTPPAKLTVTTSPTGAMVWIDDEQAGVAPLTREYTLTAKQRVRVKAQLDGYEEGSRAVDLSPKKETKLNLKLKKIKAPKAAPAHLTISSDPLGATVFVDGVKVGVTPFRLDRQVAQPVQVAIRLVLNGYEPAEQQATLDPKNEEKLDVTLSKLPPPNPIQLSPVGTVRGTSPAREVRFSPDGRQVAVIGNDHTLTIYDIASGRTVKQVKEPENTFVLITPDWKNLIYISLLDDGKKQWASILLQNVADDKSGRVLAAGMPDVASMNHAWTDGTRLVMSGQGGGTATIDCLDMKTGQAQAFSIRGRFTVGMTSGDGRLVATFRELPGAGTATNLILMRGTQHSDQQQIPIMDSDIGQQIFLSPSGGLVAVNTARRMSSAVALSKGVRVFDSMTGKQRFASADQVALGFVAQGTHLLTWSPAQGGTLDLLDAVSYGSVGKARSPRLWLSPDGSLGASQSPDGTLAISSLTLNTQSTGVSKPASR